VLNFKISQKSPKRMKRITERIINRIIALRRANISFSAIAQSVKVSISTVKRNAKDIAVRGKKNKGGRPRKVSLDATKALVKNFKEKNLKPSEMEI
jgi:transposase